MLSLNRPLLQVDSGESSRDLARLENAKSDNAGSPGGSGRVFGNFDLEEDSRDPWDVPGSEKNA